MSSSNSDRAYTMGRSKEETERLIQQSGLYEDITRRLLADAGLFTGMKVLDLGSGAGDVAFAAAELVGSEGEVLGVDMNSEILETARARGGGSGFSKRPNLWRGIPKLWICRTTLMPLSDAWS